MKKFAVLLAGFASLTAMSGTAEAQRFGDFYYTTQAQVPVRGQTRLCKLMGYDFARFDARTSRVVKIDLPRTAQCTRANATRNGECCAVFYQNPGQNSAAAQGRTQTTRRP